MRLAPLSPLLPIPELQLKVSVRDFEAQLRLLDPLQEKQCSTLLHGLAKGLDLALKVQLKMGGLLMEAMAMSLRQA